MSDQKQRPGRSFIDVLGVLWRRKWTVIGITMAGSIGVLAFALVSILLPQDTTYLPNYFTPEAEVIINDSGAAGVSDLLKASGLGNLAGLAGIGSSGPTAAGLAMKIASTNAFLDQIAEDFEFFRRYKLAGKLYPKTSARKILLDGLKFKVDAGSGMMTVGYKSTDKELATEIVNRVVGLLEEQFASIAVDKNRTQLALISQKLRDVEAEMLRIQGEVNSLQAAYNTYDLSSFAQEIAKKLLSLRSDLVQKSFEIDSYRSAVGIEDPALRRLKAERDALRANIEKLERGYREDGIIIPSQAEIPIIVLRYTRLKGDLDVQKKIFETLVQQQELVKLQVGSVPPVFQVYERATVPERKSGPSRPKICVVVAGASLFLGIALAFIQDSLKRALQDPKSVRRLRGLSDEG
jgi:tyrosine-protein kinase Etk/Wzc